MEDSGFSNRLKFSDWSNASIPSVSAGVYAIWNKDTLLYCGMSGREIEKAIALGKSKYGMVTRLNSHASGRLSGDQFCVYVANRLVIPFLTQSDLMDFSTGKLTLDKLTKKYVRDNLDYQYLLVQSSAEARLMEDKARRGEVFGVKPLLNPL